jgi:hypothetical protein
VKQLNIATNHGHLDLAIEGKYGTATAHYTEPPASRANQAALNGLESLVLAHACAGIDVTSPKYLEGLNTALDAIENVYADYED